MTAATCAIDVAEDLLRIERRTDGVADLDERREETRATFGDEPRADVQVAEKEERYRGKQEPRLDEDDLDHDHRGEAPEELRSTGAPIQPIVDRVRRSVPRMSCSAMIWPRSRTDERGRGDRAGDDHLADPPGDAIDHRQDHELEGHRGDTRADRLRGGVPDDADRRLPRHEVVHEAGGSRDERERSRREEHDTGEDRDFGRGQLDVRRYADRPERQENAERPDVEGDGRGLVTEHVLDTERQERNRDEAGDRDEDICAGGNRSHRRPSSTFNRMTGPFRPGIRGLSVD